jgi:hypothetical protein
MVFSNELGVSAVAKQSCYRRLAWGLFSKAARSRRFTQHLSPTARPYPSLHVLLELL